VAASAGGDAVVLPELAVHDFSALFQDSPPYQAVEAGIELARAQAIAVMGKLLQHPQPVDSLLGGVMEDVELDEVHRETFSIHDNGSR
jgi:predicted hotdog family 3-hydroxylacyl-ACP dehydratase